MGLTRERVLCHRATDPDTQRITEHVYLKASAAESRIQKLLDKEGAEVLVMEHEDIYRLRNQPIIEPMWCDEEDYDVDGEDVDEQHVIDCYDNETYSHFLAHGEELLVHQARKQPEPEDQLTIICVPDVFYLGYQERSAYFWSIRVHINCPHR